MNILFLTLSGIFNLDKRGIYTDLLRKFVQEGHNVYITAPAERRMHEATNVKYFDGYCVLRVRTANMQKTNVIEKGIGTLTIEMLFLKAIKKYYGNAKFDLVLYSTPPITFANVIDYIKKRDGAKSYLLLKDIFPQNAIDLGMFSKKGILYKYFRSKEKQLYRQSDYIGCMSQANVEYVLEHNPYIDKNIVHVSPNSIESVDIEYDENRKIELRTKYNIPLNTTVFIYGGNLGKPQGIPFVIECLRANANKPDRFFVICGTGTEYPKLKRYIDEEHPENVLLINGLPKQEYEDFITSCDVGMIFLDKRFTIPNFPSRLLSYMQSSMPVLACTDENTDVGKVITEGQFGWWCKSDDATEVTDIIDKIVVSDIKSIGENGLAYLKKYYTVSRSYEVMMEKYNENRCK